MSIDGRTTGWRRIEKREGHQHQRSSRNLCLKEPWLQLTMGQALSLPFALFEYTRTFYAGFFHYLWGTGRSSPYRLGSYSTFALLRSKPSDSQEELLFKQHARVHLYTLAANFYLYNKPHYRKVRTLFGGMNARCVLVEGVLICSFIYLRARIAMTW